MRGIDHAIDGACAPLRASPRRSLATRARLAVQPARVWIASLGPAPLGEGLAFSTARGRPRRPAAAALRHAATAAGGCRRRASNVDPRFLALLLAYEDKRFHDASRRRSARARARRSRSWCATAASSPAARPSPCRWRGCLSRAAERTLRGQAAADGARGRARAHARARTRSSRSISASRPMAAISKACARLRSPISARSRAA